MIKKNITINFCGNLYNIDEDAYELLNHYTESIRRYYRTVEGGEEVADDIEARIAELFNEEMAKGVNAINIELTESIIKRIGEIEEITDSGNAGSASGGNGSEGGNAASSNDCNGNEGGATATDKLRSGANAFAEGVADGARSAWDTMRSGKRFFLDTKNKVVAGVLAGCAQYFGGTPFAWRLCFVLAIFMFHGFTKLFHLDTSGMFGLLVVGYFIVAIIAPKAEKPEDVLQMKGKDVTPQNIADEVARQSTNKPSGFSQFVSIMWRLILMFVVFWLVIAFAAMVCSSALFMTDPVHYFGDMFDHWDAASVASVFEAIRQYLIVAFIVVFIALFILIYCCIHAITSSSGRAQAMSVGQRMTWLVAFIGCCTIITFCIVRIVTVVKPVEEKYREAYNKKWEEEWNREHVHDGITYYNDDWEYFEEEGFRVVKAENFGEARFTLHGEYYTGDDDYRYFDACRAGSKELVYHIERADSVAAGKYQLSCVARASKGAKGVYIYYIVEKDSVALDSQKVAVVAEGNEGRNIYSSKEYALPNIGTEMDLEDVMDVNHGKGYGWSYLHTATITVPKGAVVKYGLTTDRNVTGEKCTAEWVSACDFKLKNAN